MPNTEVKLLHAKSSWGIAPCEGRTLPRKCEKQSHSDEVAFFVCLKISLLSKLINCYVTSKHDIINTTNDCNDLINGEKTWMDYLIQKTNYVS